MTDAKVDPHVERAAPIPPDQTAPQSRIARFTPIVNLVAGVAMIAAAGTIVLDRRSGDPPAMVRESIPLDAVATLGDRTAPLALLEWGDHECSACKQFALDMFPVLKARYIDTGKVFFAFKHFPLPRHEFAPTAAAATECARRQGRFWELHAALFARGPMLDETRLQAAAAEAGLPIDSLRMCIAADAGGVVTQDVATARRLGLKATPTFMLGKVTREGTLQVQSTIVGLASGEAFYQALDKMLK